MLLHWLLKQLSNLVKAWKYNMFSHDLQTQNHLMCVMNNNRYYFLYSVDAYLFLYTMKPIYNEKDLCIKCLNTNSS
ncbi:hypothetical protein HanPI659440_Chr15g0606101 [Helianthus annuus]|nr:hypothetical protein HanPI659440_Chr15g0606101 [Helianthus annuus]